MNEAEEQNNKRPKEKEAKPTRSFDSSVTGPGNQIGSFRIERELGRGGAGVVYLAHDTKLDRLVAIKSIPPELAENPKARSRFSREARVLASLNHPHIATIHEEIEDDKGVDYLVLEYVPGQTLAEHIAKKPLKLEEVLSLALQIAEAVAAAHEHDVIHRDLKPSNIKITPEGKVKVLDFGLAKVVSSEAVDQQSTVTEPGRVIGTPAYMSPEQARGKPTDKRSDIWSFGCVLYEMLTATVPFKGETISDTLANILQTDPNWRALSDSTPANIVLLLRRCLEKEPRRRLRDIGDIAITLEETTTELQRPTLRIEAPEIGQTKSTAGSRRVLPWLVTGVAVSVLVFFAFIIGLKLGRPAGKSEGKPASLPTIETIKSIVVLPFENQSGDSEQEYFVNGMTDELSAELGKISALMVKGPYSAKRYKDTDKQTPDIARELGVDAVIRGSVFKPADANNVRITTQLIHGPTEENLWGDSYEGDLSDVITLQREVALAIAKEIKVKLTPQEEERLATARPINPKALDAFLKGRFSYFKFTDEGFILAKKHLEDAIRIDPYYAEAYAWLSTSYWMPSVWGYSKPEGSFLKAMSAANTAIKLDKTCAGAHRAVGWIALAYEWEWQKAKQSFDRARELNPNDPEVYTGLAWYLVVAGRLDEAMEMMRTAVKLDPLSHVYNEGVAWMYLFSGKFEQAIEQRKKTLKSAPDFVWAMDGLAEDYVCMSMYPEAITTLERAITLAGRTPALVTSLAVVYALSGRKDEADTLLQELQERAASDSEYVLPIYFAELYASLGNTDEAFRWLEKAYQERNWGMVFLRIEHEWDTLRSDPRFDDLVQRMNFPEAPVSESAAKAGEAAKAPIEKITVPAKKKLHTEPLPLQTSLLMSRGDSIALSSDGKYIVYVGVDALGTQRLYLRDMENDFEATPIRGTEGATCPFFRPDGRWIGFFAEDRSTARHELKKVSMQGAAPEYICNVPPLPCGGCWSIEDDSIIFSPMYHESLIKVPATGGAGQRITELDPNNDEYGHLWPDVLPRSKGLLYTVWGGESFTDYRTVVKWKNKNQPQELLSNSSFARYVPTGHIVFMRQGSLMAIRFDVDNPPSGMIREDPRVLRAGLGQTVYGGAQFTIAGEDGTFASADGNTPLGLTQGELVWVDPEDGSEEPIPDSKQFYNEWARPRLSPDEKWIALGIATKTHPWLYKLGSGWFGPLTFMKGRQGGAVWEPSGNHIVFYHQSANSPPDVYWQPKDSSDAYELLYKTENSEQGTSFSPDGKYLAMTLHHVDEASRALTSDIWMLDMQTRETEKWIETPQYNEWGADFSPDGKWIAYVSNETGDNEVWVKEFRGSNREKITSDGGSEVMWGPDKNKLELFYRGSQQFWRIEVEIEPQFRVVNREPLFENVYIMTKFPGHRCYDFSKQRCQFLMIRKLDNGHEQKLMGMTLNWFEELKRLMPPVED